MTWHIWTDGSCINPSEAGRRATPKGGRGFGGWAAIIEHGSDGRVLRGRVDDTTNVRMELHAAIEGLRVVPDGAMVVLRTDCTTLLIVHERWRHDALAHRDGLRFGPDIKLWRRLGQELDRVDVDFRLVLKGDRDPIHNRCHTIAGAEARGGLRNLPANHAPLDELGGDDKIRKGYRRVLRVASSPGASATA